MSRISAICTVPSYLACCLICGLNMTLGRKGPCLYTKLCFLTIDRIAIARQYLTSLLPVALLVIVFHCTVFAPR